MCKFNENEVRIMGRTASGVKGIELTEGAECIGAEVTNEDDKVVILTSKGYGKQTFVNEYRETKRGSKGVKALNITEKNGNIATFKIYKENSDLVIITDSGMTMRMPLDQVNTLSRVTQGVRLIHLKDEQVVSTISVVEKEKETDEVVEEVIEENDTESASNEVETTVEEPSEE
jgi:DNA gyrase subunit A